MEKFEKKKMPKKMKKDKQESSDEIRNSGSEDFRDHQSHGGDMSSAMGVGESAQENAEMQETESDFER